MVDRSDDNDDNPLNNTNPYGSGFRAPSRKRFRDSSAAPFDASMNIDTTTDPADPAFHQHTNHHFQLDNDIHIDETVDDDDDADPDNDDFIQSELNAHYSRQQHPTTFPASDAAVKEARTIDRSTASFVPFYAFPGSDLDDDSLSTSAAA